MFLRILFSLLISFFIYNFSFAQLSTTTNNTGTSTNINLINNLNSSTLKCPDHVFLKDYSYGAKNEEIKLLQKILNADSRTRIAKEGPGSPGFETNVYGPATRNSLKKFQALFIEFLGIADGKFTNKTRVLMNYVCKGPFFSNNIGSGPFDVATTSNDILAPIVNLVSINEIEKGNNFRVIINSIEEIKMPTLDKLIISGGTATDLRKLSPTSYSILITPNLDVGDEIKIRFEAEAFEDIAGNKTIEATNELIIKVIPSANDTLNDLLASTSLQSLSDLPTLTRDQLGLKTDCSKVSNISLNDFSNPCYGISSFSGTGSSGGGGLDAQSILTSIVGTLVGRLVGGLVTGGLSSIGLPFGGLSTGVGYCACTKLPTQHIVSFTGPSGAYTSLNIPGAGKFLGRYGPPLPIGCGQILLPPTEKGKCPGVESVISAGICCNPMLDTTGKPYVGSMVPGFTFGGI